MMSNKAEYIAQCNYENEVHDALGNSNLTPSEYTEIDSLLVNNIVDSLRLFGADNGARWYVSKTFFNENYIECKL